MYSKTFLSVVMHVLRGVHGDVDASIKQSLLELLHEDAARTDLTERASAIAVAGRRDGNESDLDARPAQPARGQLGLREREPTAAGTDADQHCTRCARRAFRRRDCGWLHARR